MRNADDVLNFLEAYDLLRLSVRSAGDDSRIGTVLSDEQIAVVDWERLVSSANGMDERESTTPATDESILDGLGRPRDPESAVPNPWERCAWYAPMHYYGRSWGIYLSEGCVIRIAMEIGSFARDLPRTFATVRHLKSAAFFTLFLHEHFHHKVEGFGIRLALSDRSSPDHYLRYDSAVYRPTLGTDDNLEEALANADAYRRLSTSPYSRVLPAGVRAAVRRWMEWRFQYVDPPGYRMARHYLRDNAFVSAAELLQTQLFEGSLMPSSNPSHWKAGPHMLRSVYPITSNIYVVVPMGTPSSFPTTGPPHTMPLP